MVRGAIWASSPRLTCRICLLPTSAASADKAFLRCIQVEGRDIKGDLEVLSRQWTRLWAVVVVIAVLVNGWSGLRDSALQEAGSETPRLSERERQEKFIQERIQSRREQAEQAELSSPR